MHRPIKQLRWCSLPCRSESVREVPLELRDISRSNPTNFSLIFCRAQAPIGLRKTGLGMSSCHRHCIRALHVACLMCQLCVVLRTTEAFRNPDVTKMRIQFAQDRAPTEVLFPSQFERSKMSRSKIDEDDLTSSGEEDEEFGSLDLTSEWDVQQAVEWNGPAPELVHSCVHELFEAQAKRQPEALAIRAWDRDFKYGQLNIVANRLCHMLVNDLAVKAGDLVHVCFEKSAWFFVAMLAIMKAGAAWVPLDPSHPSQRLQQIVRQTGAKLALTSADKKPLCEELVAQVVEVTEVLERKLETDGRSGLEGPACEVTPRHAAYVLFTSGSTGTPKGLVMEHGSVCTSQKAIGERLGLTPEVRMLQFAAFVFDLSIGEILAPLIAGACVCVPSEHMRMNGLKEFILDMQINWAFLTPAFARTLRPEDVPSLELLLLAGEAVGRDVFDRWFGRVRLINGWGPAETCVFSTLHEWQSASESPLTIGKPVGGWCWIVNPEDPQRLAPAGCLGEVVIQGPTLLREYLADPERTAASIIRTLPDWAPEQKSPFWNRFFRSGDLCSYNADGTIEFSSRKDTQVKIRGLRVELGEVEHHTRAALNDVKQVVVDVFTTDAGTTLAAFFAFSEETCNISTGAEDDHTMATKVFLPLTTDLKRQITTAAGELNVALPNYMVPTLFIPCRCMPSITSTKLDRSGLRRLAAALTRDQIAHYALLDSEKNAPVTDLESRLQEVWAKVLHLPTDAIGRDDSFLRIGGDSITAIQMVTIAREAGISVTVKDTFDDPRLSSVAAKAVKVVDDDETHVVESFSLLPPGKAETIKSQVREQCALGNEQMIEDAFPCTSLQEGLMALAVKQPGSYTAKSVYSLPSHVDLTRFKRAWERTVNFCGNLRTRIALLAGVSIQALIAEDVAWEATAETTLSSFMKSTSALRMGYGSRLCRYAIIEELNGERFFVLVIHHAVFDGWSLGLILGTLQQAYDDEVVSAGRSYAGFIEYTMNVDTQAASDYWTEQLRDATRASFPPSSSTEQSQSVSRIMKTHIPFPRMTDTSITKATILRAAWAIVLARYCDSDDICFGATVSGRHAPAFGVEGMVGPTVATVPVRICLDRQQTVTGMLQQVQSQATEMVAYEQFGLRNISKLGSSAKEACDASSLLIIQPMEQSASAKGAEGAVITAPNPGTYGIEDASEGYFTYPLVLQGMTFDEHVELHLNYNANLLSEACLEALSQQFSHVVQQLLAQDERPLGELSLAGQWDLQQARDWNGDMAMPVQKCMHDLITQQAANCPGREALFSSEGSVSYGELEMMTTQVATLLSQLGVGPEVMVPVCFEKSTWAIIAMLGVMKAGGAFVSLDPSHAATRRKALVEESGAHVMLVSPSTADDCRGMTEHMVELSRTLMSQLPAKTSEDSVKTTRSSPANAAYVIFTSGSTGKPKSIVVEHSAMCTSVGSQKTLFDIDQESRVLQFSSYVFDVCMTEIFATLSLGGTVCVPTDVERLQNIAEFIRTARVNAAMLTPSFVQTFTPSEVPTLKTVVLAGEAPTRANLKMWYGHVKLINAYGPTESCIYCTSYEYQSPDESPATIGRGTYGSCWVVDPDDHNRLAPIGCTGELLIQGHGLARGYAGNEAATARSFIDHVSWLPSSATDHASRFYKTGDLVRYRSDGMLEYLGRRDTQIKLRGQRIELGAIEAGIKQMLPKAEHVAVDVVGQGAREALVAFVSFDEKAAEAEGGVAEELAEDLLAMDDGMRAVLVVLADDLKTILPPYMVPSLFLPLRCMPFGTSMKLDRKRLRELAGGLTQERLTTFSLASRTWVAPTTTMELRLREVWAQVLKITAEEIGKNDSFLQIGGDSIAAIQMVTVARKAGIALTIKDIFDDARLSKVSAQAVEVTEDDESHVVEPFSLLPDGKAEAIKSQLRAQCALSDTQSIEDAYPCTSVQEGLLALAVKQPGSYMAKHVYRIPAHVDLARFTAAWERTVELCGILRTRIVLLAGFSVQALIAEDVAWEATANATLSSFMNNTSALRMGYGSRLCRYAIIEELNGERFFVLVIHHAVFDGWSLGLILGTLQQAYDDEVVSAGRSYAGFIEYTMNVDTQAASDYWTEQLRDATRASFPPSSSTEQSQSVSRIMKTHIPFPRMTDTSITKATILRAAWAIVLARYCDSDDICFGATMSGRHAPVYGVEGMVGPTVATVPVRIRLDRQQTVTGMLQQVQSQATEMVAYEQFGLRNISRLGPGPREACDMSSLMIIQPTQSVTSDNDDKEGILAVPNADMYGEEEALEGYFTYALVIQGITYDEHVELSLTYHADVLSEARLEALSSHFAQAVQQLLTPDERPLSALSLAGEWDLQKSMEWNEMVTAPVEVCVHDLIAQRAAQSPDREALFSAEGSLSYADLERMSTQLAIHLSQLGVGPETMVPVCFEKSMWTIIAMLSVMKAGGAFVPLDPSHTSTRRQALVNEIDARFMLVSPSTADACQDMVEHTIELSTTLFTKLATTPEPIPNSLQRHPSPANAAYVIFTSGSTGKPKTIVVEHSALCTSVIGHGRAYSMTEESRVLQFSSYTFDICLSEILTTLVYGGTVCTPTEMDRLQNIPGFIESARVNIAMLTSSFMNTLSPSEVPRLETMIFVGEAPTAANVEAWHGHVRLINGFGPAEAVIICSTYEFQSPDESPTIIGRGTYGPCWVVDPDDHNRLAPIGCTGELLIQGHGLARGYAGNEAATARSFIDHVSWLPSSATDHASRFYKTGDLVRYRSDGMLEYLGRRDTQIKLRGQRIELGAIEAGIKQMLPKAEHVAVDVVGQGAREALVAFVSFDEKAAEAEGGVAEELAEDLLAMDDGMRAVLVVLADDLKTILPPYMVPSLFLPLRCMPFGTSMKLDRKRLRELAGGLTQERLTTFSLASRTWVAPTTTMELRLREVWAQVLKITAEEIGKNDSFLQIGGDSIAAIQMVTVARKAGIALTIKDIFDDARLSKVSAQAVEVTEDDESHVVEPFSLLPDGKAEAIKSQLRAQCALSDTQSIEDAYPCTSVQEGLLALAVKQPGSYMAKHVYRIPAHVDLARFTAAWERTVELCGILRTRIVLLAGFSVQALIAEDVAWEATANATLSSFMNNTSALRMGYGSRLCRYAIIEELNGERFFVLVIHHAVFDGWSLGLILGTLQQAYDDEVVSAGRSYAGFIEYTMNVDTQAASDYWTEQLRDATRASFPPSSSTEQSQSVSRIMKTHIPFPRMTDTSITKATILRAAWAIVLARYCDSDDICFGATMSGRHAPVYGVEGMVGPTVATVPVRIRLDRQQTVTGMLQQVQSQATEMVAYEQFGLRNISKLGSSAKEACDASSLLVIQPMEQSASAKGAEGAVVTATTPGTYGIEDTLEGYFTYPLVLQAMTFDQHVELRLNYNANLLSEACLEALSQQFGHVVQQLLAQDELLLRELSLAGQWDLQQAKEWNSVMIGPVQKCMHDLITQQATNCPEREALFSSEGSVSYGELEMMTTQVATLLSQLGVGPEVMVPVCFEKSTWAIIAMLGVMKAGGAFVSLDPSHAATRRKALVEESGAHVMLVSPSTADDCRGMTEHMVELSRTLM
nr:nonribosomal peptide synthetase easa [Quercus suber]